MSNRAQAAKVAGVGVAACAACCAGPILAWLGAIGLGTVGGIALFGGFAAVAGVAAVAVLWWRRRRQATCEPPEPEPVAVHLTPR